MALHGDRRSHATHDICNRRLMCQALEPLELNMWPPTQDEVDNETEDAVISSLESLSVDISNSSVTNIRRENAQTASLHTVSHITWRARARLTGHSDYPLLPGGADTLQL